MSMEWKTSNRIPDEFHDVARAVYRGDPNWIPESPASTARAFGPGNRYFEKNRAWLSCEPGAARLAGFYNPELAIDGRGVAFFGYWETVDEFEPNKKLFSDFESWARSLGAGAVYGPINFTTFGPNRVRLNRYEDGCFPGEPYNPPYYEHLLEHLGYSVAYRYYTLMGDLESVFRPLDGHMLPILRKAEEKGISFVPLSPEFWDANIERIFEYIEIIFSDNFAYTPITFEDFRGGMGTSFSRVLCPHASVLARDPDGEIAGFFVNFPDYSPLCRQGAGEPVPAGEVSYNRHFTMIREPMILGKSGGVHPRWRNLGLFTLMSYLGMKWSLPHYRRVAAATCREDNYSLKVARLVFSNPGDIEHRYGLFVKDLA
jgi:hypothetical protein